MTRHVREWNGRCLECQEEQLAGGDWQVCSHAEEAEDDEPLRGICAWCGHRVTA